MSPSGDQVAVPTNGHRPPLTDPEVDTHLAEATEIDDEPEWLEPAASRIGVAVSPPSVSPGKLAVGLGMVAGIILIALGRRRPRG